MAVFFAGFACGLLFLTVVLWRTGSLVRAAAPRPAGAPTQPARPTQPPTPMPQKNEPAPAANPTGLLVPVEGVRPQDLRDDFNEIHAGHRHEALDILAPRGTPVLAAADGTIVKLFLSKAGGLTVYEFDPTATYCFYYAHLDRYAAGTREGQAVRKGDVLAYVGSTGDASPDAPHLHFAMYQLGPEKRWWEGTAIDPYPWLTGGR